MAWQQRRLEREREREREGGRERERERKRKGGGDWSAPPKLGLVPAHAYAVLDMRGQASPSE